MLGFKDEGFGFKSLGFGLKFKVQGFGHIGRKAKWSRKRTRVDLGGATEIEFLWLYKGYLRI